jgi:FlaA1/EpsC-like NDP-sugar epimerase
MTIEEAVRLVLKSITISRGGEVFVTKMPVVRIQDLAEGIVEVLAPKYGHKSSDVTITEIGAKPGEKLYEELISSEEIHRSLELKDMFVITPAFKSVYESIQYKYPDTVSEGVQKPYISSVEKALNKEELKQYLLQHKVLTKVEEGLHESDL